jgi:hypothetical protein
MRNNFSFKKHQRELDKKKKKEEKALAKLAKKNQEAAAVANPLVDTTPQG